MDRGNMSRLMTIGSLGVSSNKWAGFPDRHAWFPNVVRLASWRSFFLYGRALTLLFVLGGIREQEMTAACTDATTPMQFGMATAMATEVLKHDFDTMHM